MKILCTFSRLNEQAKKRLSELCPDIEYNDYEHLSDEQLSQYEVIIGNPPVNRLGACKSLKWLQLQSAGANQYTCLPEDVILTNASGAFGSAISEYMVGCVLLAQRSFAEYYLNKQEKKWQHLTHTKTIEGSTVVSVGMGDIGTDFAYKMHQFGATVYGVRRSVHDKPDFVKELYSFKDIDKILPECDIVALSLPETKETIHMFDKKRLLSLKKDAILINVGRGSAIVSEDLAEVMKEGHLMAACLDVFEKEPLPEDSPLWEIPNIYMKPHVSGQNASSLTNEKRFKIAYDNLKNYLTHKPLDNIVNKKIGY